MLELRWVLLGLGLLVFAGVYLWTVISPRLRDSYKRPTEAVPLTEVPEFQGPAAALEKPADLSSIADPGNLHRPGTPRDGTQEEVDPPRIVTLRFIPRKGRHLDAQQTVLALRNAGLRHGPYGIFHYYADENARESDFSVANLIEPGSFDLTSLAGSTLPGITYFMELPGAGDPVRRFDLMVDSARALAQSLDAEILDEQGSSWSIQRQRFVREELIEYRHRMSRNLR